jgi:predicted Zn finger-like uncharacterized protein
MAVEIVQCPQCQMKYRLDPDKFSQKQLKIRCKRCGNSFEVTLGGESPSPSPLPAEEKAPPPPPSPRPSPPKKKHLALIAHDQEEMLSELRSLLEESGYEVISARDGIEALTKIVEKRPQIAVLDVALPRMFGFEVCEVVRRDRELDGVRLLLIAAVFDRTRYKRAPHTLYGADDYIEKHHIPDSLVDKVNRLVLGGVEAPREEEVPRVVPPEVEEKEERLRTRLKSLEYEGLSPEVVDRARRLARLVISDIALYNQEKVEQGVRSGNLRELLKEELNEGVELLKTRLKGEIPDPSPFLDEAVEEFLRGKSKEYGL